MANREINSDHLKAKHAKQRPSQRIKKRIKKRTASSASDYGQNHTDNKPERASNDSSADRVFPKRPSLYTRNGKHEKWSWKKANQNCQGKQMNEGLNGFLYHRIDRTAQYPNASPSLRISDAPQK